MYKNISLLKLLLLVALASYSCSGSGQDTVVLRQFGRMGCTYLEMPSYIVNENYVVYQYCNVRTILYPDMASFRIPDNAQESGIAMDRNGIYFRGQLLKADTAGFKLVGRSNDYQDIHWLWKTRTTVYRDTTPVAGADAATFAPIECFNGAYFKDRRSVYYFDKRIKGSDGSTVSRSCDESCYDKNNRYEKGEIVYFNRQKLQPVNTLFARTANAVIYNGRVFPGLDAATVKALSRSYVMDKHAVYYGNTKSPVRPERLKHVKVWEQVNRAYVSDGLHVYAGADILEKDFDAATFGMLPHSDFCYDKNGVYERRWIEKSNKVINSKFPFKYTVAVSPQNTFITDDSRYIIYDHQAYDPWIKKWFGRLSAEQLMLAKQGKLYLAENDTAKSGEPSINIGNIFTVSGGTVFYRGKRMRGVDAASFRYLPYGYAGDKNHVYLLTQDSLQVIEAADAASFEVVYGFLGKDKDNVYKGSTPIISSHDIALLAIFSGYRPGCGLDKKPGTNYYFFKNKHGFWLLETTPETEVKFLGTAFNPKWNKVFENFELPAETPAAKE